jgi:hypothetical protein
MSLLDDLFETLSGRSRGNKGDGNPNNLRPDIRETLPTRAGSIRPLHRSIPPTFEQGRPDEG